ncbi:LacI family transcriptional regulator [Hahella sp. HN01]|uniref:LacI family transcriptional regulator n=1 Tax=Hahella sp. HN01 TaxID=2847262 RepID=UPI001C1F015E|nr:LacI family transcriptional regulator [Hahella sp. HN01]MBU6955911.1 LacI family transcriptional regulator [Hahella sp. HN01]
MSGTRIQSTGRTSLITDSHGAVTLTTPIRFKRRSGRKLVTLPEERKDPRPWDKAITPLQVALARAHRWWALLASGEAETLRDIAAKEGVDNSYVSRILNLTLLPPDIVAAILDDALPNHITLFDLAVDPPLLWEEQRERVQTSMSKNCCTAGDQSERSPF